MRRILFVCTGNTCRSPMAEALFRAKVAGVNIEVRSAGIAAFDGQEATPHALHVLSDRGITHQHQAQRLNESHITWADLILTMTQNHKDLILSFFPQAAGKVHQLNAYVGLSQTDIGDPFGGGLDTYQKCADELEQALEQLNQKLTC